MRASRSLRLSLAFAVLASAALGAQACVDDDKAPAPGLNLDGGFDAPVSETGPGIDATTDSPAPDANPQGLVTVVVANDKNEGIAGVQVAFYDGATVDVITTDDKGSASRIMNPGGHVTVAELRDGARKLTTILSVEPGDTLSVLGGAPSQPNEEPTFATITFNNVQAFATGDDVEFSAGCNSTFKTGGGSPPDLSVPASCVKNGEVTLLLVARNTDTGNAIVAYATKKAQVTDGGTTNVDIATGDWVVATQRDTSFAGTAPAFFENASHEVSYWTGGQRYLSQLTSPQTGDLSSMVVDVPPASFVELWRSFTRVTFFDGADGGAVSNLLPASTVIKQAALPAGDAGFGRSYNELLPRIHSLDFQSNGAVQAANWKSDGTVSSVGGYVYMSGTIDVDGSLESIEWNAIFPPGNAYELPPLPAALASFQPTDPLTFIHLGVVDSPEIGSYKNFRGVASKYFYLHTADDPTALPPTAPFTAKITSLILNN